VGWESNPLNTSREGRETRGKRGRGKNLKVEAKGEGRGTDTGCGEGGSSVGRASLRRSLTNAIPDALIALPSPVTLLLGNGQPN
jgi:hypothetical protein